MSPMPYARAALRRKYVGYYQELLLEWPSLTWELYEEIGRAVIARGEVKDTPEFWPAIREECESRYGKPRTN